MGVGGQRHAPVALPPRKTQYLLYRRLGKLPGIGLYGCGNSRPPTWVRSWAVQPEASRYTNCAIPVHNNNNNNNNNNNEQPNQT